MKTILSYVRSLLGWCDEESTDKDKLKRDRTEEDYSSDDDAPEVKKYKRIKPTFHNMKSKDVLYKNEQPARKIRYVPIQLESDHPSTSTPYETQGRISRVSSDVRNDHIKYFVMPKKLHEHTSDKNVSFIRGQAKENTEKKLPRLYIDLDEFENGEDDDIIIIENTPQPVKYIQVKDKSKNVAKSNEDRFYSLPRKFKYQDTNGDVTMLDRQSETENKPKKIYIDLDEIDHTQDDKEDVIYVKKVNDFSPIKPFYRSKHDHIIRSPLFKSMDVRVNNDGVSSKIKTFKTPAGISKSYKKRPIPLPQRMNKSQYPLNQKDKLHNGDFLLKVYNLDAKKDYRALIEQVSEITKPVSVSKDTYKPSNVSACLRATQNEQRKSLNSILSTEKALKHASIDKNCVGTNEFDPITVAALSSSDSEVEIVPSETSTSSSVRIDPVNTLKDSFKDMAVTKEDYVTKLESKYRQTFKKMQEQADDARRVSDIISKVNSEQRSLHLQQKLKYELSIPESLMVEPIPSVELPKLTAEQEMSVNKAIGHGPMGQLMVEKFNLRIHRRDLHTLAGLNWLNDEVINFYMNLLMQRSEHNKESLRVYATNTFFYTKLTQSGQAGIKRWTRKVDIFAYDLMVVPIHLGVHWCMSLVDFKNKKISYLDSMGGTNMNCLKALRQYLRDEHQDKKGQPFDDSGWTADCVKNIPQQMNGSDCGVFSCTFAEFACRNAPFTFTQSHMPYLRRKMVLEILTGKLLL